MVIDKKIGIDENADGRADYYLADVLQAQDYYPFGMEMPGRTCTKAARPQNYRFGFNGKEQDPEVYGQGNIYDYGFRIYNPRIAKFLSVDPLTKDYPMLTPYQFASNRPIDGIDLDGLEYYPAGMAHMLREARGVRTTEEIKGELEGNIVITQGLVDVTVNPLIRFVQGGLGVNPILYQLTKFDIFLGKWQVDLSSEYGFSKKEFTTAYSSSLDKIESMGDAISGISLAFGSGTAGTKTAITGPDDFSTLATRTQSGIPSLTRPFKPFTKTNYRYNLQVFTGKSGVGFDAHPPIERIDYNLFSALGPGTSAAFRVISDQILGFGKIFRGEVEAGKNVAGPIRIGTVSS